MAQGPAAPPRPPGQRPLHNAVDCNAASSAGSKAGEWLPAVQLRKYDALEAKPVGIPAAAFTAMPHEGSASELGLLLWHLMADGIKGDMRRRRAG